MSTPSNSSLQSIVDGLELLLEKNGWVNKRSSHWVQNNLKIDLYIDNLKNDVHWAVSIIDNNRALFRYTIVPASSDNLFDAKLFVGSSNLPRENNGTLLDIYNVFIKLIQGAH